MGGFEKVVWKACPLFRRPFQLKVLDRHESKDIRASAEPYSYDPETDPLLKIPPEPQGQSEAQPELVYYQLDHLGTPIAAHNAKSEEYFNSRQQTIFYFSVRVPSIKLI